MNHRGMESPRSFNEHAHSGTKRAGSGLPSPRRKRSYSPSESDNRATPMLSEGGHHVRWLIESSQCARILGPGGKRFKHMKESVKDTTLQARISPKIQDAEYRVFNCTGSAMSISRMAGLFVRYIYDEPENEHSNADSCRYDLKLLIPSAFAESLVGSNQKNLREIEERSNASLSIEEKCLPQSDERCLHIFGVADAAQIAIYFTLETMRNIENALKKSASEFQTKLFDPVCGVKLEFPAGKHSDMIPRMRTIPTTTGVGPASFNSTDRLATNGNGAIASNRSPSVHSNTSDGERSNGSLEMPDLANDEGVPQSIYTAYDIARDSRRTNLRQIIQIDSAHKGSDSDRAFLLENISRVTDCQVKQGLKDSSEEFMDESSDGDISFIVEGPPEENSLALLLMYRFIRKQRK